MNLGGADLRGHLGGESLGSRCQYVIICTPGIHYY
jgi:hypothetical protein